MIEHKNNLDKSTLWIFGHSVCLPFNLESPDDGWDILLSKKLDYNLVNLARPATDNFFIYQCYLQNKSKIKKQDTVLISWSHYSRKSFVLDRTNQQQLDVLDQSLIYKTNNYEFIRGVNKSVNDSNKWLAMIPVSRGVKYYDTWFENYYSAYEQKCNFQSYFDSVISSCGATYLPFFLSEESILDIDVSAVPNAGSVVEFILKNNVMISDNDIHFNVAGHGLWAEHLYNILKHEH